MVNADNWVPPGTRLVAPPLAGSLRSHGSELIAHDSPRTSRPWAPSLARCARHFAQGARSYAVLRPSALSAPLSHGSCYCASHVALAAARGAPSLLRTQPPGTMRKALRARRSVLNASCLKSVLLRCGFLAATRLTALRSRKAQGKPVRPAHGLPLRATLGSADFILSCCLGCEE